MATLADPQDSAPPDEGVTDRSAELKAHAALVRQVAFRLRQRLPAGTDMDELMQAGLIGLNHALERYRAELGASFDTYAARRIEGAMLDALRAGDDLSREVRARQREIRAAVQALEHRLLRAPRAQEVANELGWSLGKFHRHMVDAGAAPMRAGDAPLAEEPDREPAWTDPIDEGADPQRDLQQRQRHLALNRAYDALEERERLLMDLIYERGLDQRDAAVSLGVTPSRISQMHAAVVEKLRRRLRDW